MSALSRCVLVQELRRSADVALWTSRCRVLDGLSAIKEMHRQLPALPIVVLTSFGTQPNTLRAAKRRGWVRAQELHARRADPGSPGSARRPCIPVSHLTRLVLEMITPAVAERRRAATERLAALTPSESEILHLLVEGMSNAGIGQRLRMRGHEYEKPTQENHSERIRRIRRGRSSALSNIP